MESFAFRLPTDRVLLMLRRNPLIRLSDRIESVVTLMAVVVAILGVPVAASIGTTTYETAAERDARHAESLHQVPATVVGPVESTWVEPGEFRDSAPVRWRYNGVEHHATVDRTERLRQGDDITLWVDDTGRQSAGPAPEGRAARNAIAVALVVWTVIVAVTAAAVRLITWRLDVGRYSRWERGIAHLTDDGRRH